jgi:hypothetical protein
VNISGMRIGSGRSGNEGEICGGNDNGIDIDNDDEV